MERVPRKTPAASTNTEVSPEEKDQIARPNPDPPPSPPIVPGKEISRQQLINKLNNINFQDRTVTVVFRHRTYARQLQLKAYPLPCQNARLVCRWAERFPFDQLIEDYRFQHLHVPKGQQLLEVHPEIKGINQQQIVFTLPETCREISVRNLHRHPCSEIAVYLFQNGAAFYGTLIDFGASQFRAGISTTPPQTFGWLEPDVPVTVVFTRGNKTLYSGQCRIVRHDGGLQMRHFILEPVQRQIRRFPPRKFRSTRHRLTPPPDVVFDHPLFAKTITLKVHDLSGSGLSVEEEESMAVLTPGLIIPSLELVFSDGSCLRGMAQVVYCHPYQGSRTAMVRCGLAMLDIATEDHIRLLSLMHQVSDAHAYVCNKVDMEALWDFFFETGFIYPQKYEFLQANKATIKATYEKLYHRSPSVASHFIYQHNGRILAHMATVRYYESSWLIHHHAAIRSPHNRGGLIVLNQVGRFINESHRLASMKMDYVFCYYRPDNKFPSQVFGGAARNIKRPKTCSIDALAYFHHRSKPDSTSDLPTHWAIDAIGKDDLLDLRTFYEHRSGGLMLDALHLVPERIEGGDLSATYRQMGLKRDRHLFALRYRDKLRAVIMVNQADLGLNMSDLTDAITLLVVDDLYLTCDLVETVVARLIHYYEADTIPVLLYPEETARQMGIEMEKQYILWAYSTHDLDDYFAYLKRLLKFIQH
ncbi:MAG: hypothetical protein KFF50_09570 [Desulfatitalea sp.]|nr:hypothetical protein [Desulfatitalea sp.]